MNRTARRSGALLVIVMLSAPLLGGCASQPEPAATATPSGSGSASASARASASAGADGGVGRGGVAAGVKATPVAAIINEPGARKDVVLTTCERSPGGWSAGGTVTNSGNQKAGYTIVISFTDTHSTVLARETAELEVPSGGDRKFAVTAEFAAPADVVCVLRGVDRT